MERGALEGEFRLVGELTFDTVPGLVGRAHAIGPVPGPLRVDLSGVTRIDSAGLALLIEWVRLAWTQDQELHLLGMPAQMRDIVRVSGLDDVLPFDGPAA